MMQKKNKLTPEQSDFMKYIRKDKNYLKLLNKKMRVDVKGVKVD
jgi:hypothetical protein